MKTSLFCLLLLAAVACASPEAGRRTARRARRGKLIQTSDQRAEGMPAWAGEAGETAVATGREVEAVAEGEGEERFLFGCWGPCFSLFAGVGCLFDGCFSPFDVLYYKGFCACCSVFSLFQCF